MILLLLLFLQLIVVIIFFTCFCCICFTYSKTQLILVKLASLGFKLSIKFRMDLPPSSCNTGIKESILGKLFFRFSPFCRGKSGNPNHTEGKFKGLLMFFKFMYEKSNFLKNMKCRMFINLLF